MDNRVGWWVAGSFSTGLVLGVIIGYLLFGVLLVVETHHQAAPAPSPVAPGNCPRPWPGAIIPPGCPTS